VRELPDLLKRLAAPGNLSPSLTTILEWTRSALSLDGIALFVSERGGSTGMDTRASLGALATTAPLVGAELSRTGIPAIMGVLPFPAGTGGGSPFFCCPLNVESGTPWSALVLEGPQIENTAREREEEILVAAASLREMLAAERDGAPGTGRDGSGSVEPAHATDPLPGLSLVADGLRLPLYVCDLKGRFISASPACLELTGYASLEALAQSRELFREPEKRAAELETVRKLGKVESFSLSVMSGKGVKLQVRDSAVFLGQSILGVFFDVTGLAATNAELKDALQVQELLNDGIMSGAKQLQRTQGAAIRSLARLAEYRDPETGTHLQRICEYTRLLALQVHLRAPFDFRVTTEYANDISLSSMLHDIGKVSIPDHVLLKPGKLDPQEWDMMKKHTLFGWEVLHKADRELGEQSFLTLAATIALSHHERYDGKGYPSGIVGEQIPQIGRAHV
jgi:PAS domain-containing protein